MHSHQSLIELLDLRRDPNRAASIASAETVTRGEIVDAARQLADDLDSTTPRNSRLAVVESRSHHDLVGVIAGWLAGRSVAMLPPGDLASVHDAARQAGCGIVLQGPERTRPGPPSVLDPLLDPDLGTAGVGSAEAVVLYTSGTTSRPRGVRLSERNVLTNLTAMLRVAIGWSPSDRYGHVLSMSHSFGLSMALLAFIRAVPSVLLDNGPPSRRLLESLVEQEVSVFACVPYSLRLLDRRGLRLGRDSTPMLRELYLAGGGISDDQIAEFLPCYGGELYLMYGLTECTARVAVRRQGDGAPSGSVGLPLPGTSVDVVDDAGSVVPVGTPGLVRVASPSLMLGYLGEPPLPVDERFVTTDLGVLDAAGNLRITGRRAEMMNFRGNRVSLLAIEALVGQIAGVVDVMFRPDSAVEDAQCLVAVVTGDAADQSVIKREILRAVEPRGLIRAIEFVDSVPRTRSGKPIRR